MTKIDKLMISKATREAAKTYLSNPSHALLVVGSRGSGVDELVVALAMERLGLQEKLQLNNTPRALIIKPNKNGNISIDEIRNAWQYSKVSGSKGADQTKLVVINEAHRLTPEAQNSLLKLLEEPPEYLSFILSAPTTKAVLTTIDSRTTKLQMAGLSKGEFEDYLVQKNVAKDEIDKLRLVSSGEIYRALELSHLKTDEGLGFAKQLLSKEPFERLVAAKDFMKDRNKALEIANDMYHLSFIALRQSVMAEKETSGWLSILHASEKTVSNLEANGNVRLNLTNLLAYI